MVSARTHRKSLRPLEYAVLTVLLIAACATISIQGQQTVRLVLASYSWPIGGALTGVLLNNGTTPIDLGSAQAFVDLAPLDLSDCSILAPQQSCRFNVYPLGKVTATMTSTAYTSETVPYYTSSTTWTWVQGTYTNGYFLQILTVEGTFDFFLYYGESSTLPQQGQFYPTFHTQPQTAYAAYPSSTTQIAVPATSPGDFFIHNAFLMIGAIALGILLIGTILGLHALSLARRRQKRLYE